MKCFRERRGTFNSPGVLFLLDLLIICFHGVKTDEQEYRLTRYLMANYDSSVRPARNSSEALSVKFGLALHSIIDVDEKNQILTTNCWLTQIWEDAHLIWNSSDFGGISVIRIPFTRVWKPDIILYNNADPQYGSSTINTNVIVRSSGEVTWLSHGIYSSACDMNVEYFPFDIQDCKMKWSSWTYDGYQLNLLQQDEKGDITNYKSNGEFDLLEFIPKRNVEFYSCCPEPYTDITYHIRIRRRPMFYVVNLILPCLLINSIALLVFYVPSESGEKVTLGISALLSMTVFLITIRESLPPTEQTPLISLYYGVTICLVSFASGLSVLTLNVHHRGLRGIEVPKIVKKIVLEWAAKLVFLNFENPSLGKSKASKLSINSLDLRADIGEKYQPKEIDHISMESFHLPPRFTSCHFTGPSCAQTNPHPHTLPPHAGSATLSEDSCWIRDVEQQFMRVLSKIYQAVEKNELRIAEQDRRETTKSEWQQVALVCDRLLLGCFLLATVVATSTVLLSSPHAP